MTFRTTCRLRSAREAVRRFAQLALFMLAALQLPLYAGSAPASGAQRELTVNALSVLKVKTRAVRDARSAATLGQEREGSGVVIDAQGLVLTIGYLVIEAETVQLVTADGKTFPATVVDSDATTGMALLKALAPLPVKPVDLGVSAGIAERDLVLIVGHDGVAPAYVVSKRPFVGYWEYLLNEAIYTAPATVNWQGAALLSRDGKLLGIGSLMVGDALGTRANVPGNMFVPIDVVKPVLGDMVANGKSTAKPRPWIGVNTEEAQGNVIVTRVSPESPADDAGLRKGDVIVGVNGSAISGQADFYTKLWASGEAGVDVTLDVLKGSAVQKYVVKSRDRDSYFRAKPVY